MAGPPSVPPAWLANPALHAGRPVASLLATTVVAAVVLAAFSATGDWSRQLMAVVHKAARIREAIRVMSVTPPTLGLLPSGRDEAMISYVTRCTQPSDRVYASWFFPELY